MANAIQLRRGTTAEHSTFTGLVGEVTVDTTKDTIVVHDGATAGGFPLLRDGDTVASLTVTTADINGGTIDGAVIGGSTPAAISGTTGSFSGNLTVDTDTLFVDAPNNRVGMGTTIPGQRLQLAGGATNFIQVDDTTNGAFNLFGASNGLGILGTFSNHPLLVETNSAERMRVTEGGNVGVGTTNPAGKLTVFDTGGAGFSVAESNENLHAASNHRFYDLNYANEHMRITTAGSVGIGTTTPAALLDVNGTAKATVFTGGLTDVIFNADVKEKATVSATAATGTIAFDVLTQQVLFFTSNASGNFTVNIRGDGSNTLDSLMAVGDSITLAFLVTNGGTAYYNTAVQVDGSAVTPKWQGGSAPDAGNASSVDIYTYTVIKTGSAAFSVFASQTQFA